ncbi:hypothetical protein [Mucilaginibacter sp. HD30]
MVAYRIIIVCVLMLGNLKLLSQPLITDTALTSTTTNAALQLYQNAMSGQLKLYNGPEYKYENPNIKGSPFFNESNEWQKGTVGYDGAVYQNVSMRYDLFKDELVLLHYNGVFSFYLIKDKVNFFDFGQHYFTRVKVTGGIPAGYYEVLYNGSTTILAKHNVEHQPQVGTQSGNIYGVFKHAKRYFVAVNDQYESFKKPAALPGILKDKKEELRRFIKTNKIDIKNKPEESIAIIAAEYDRLKNIR